MKMNKLITTVAVALAGVAFFQTAAKAQATTGDLLLGFQTASPNTGNSLDLETNLGLYSNFTGLANGVTVNLTDGFTTAGQTGAFSITDLNNTYGSSATALKFSVSGTLGALGNNEVFISNSGNNPPTQTPTNGAAAGIGSMIGTFNGGTAGAAGSTDITVSTSTAGSYQKIAATNGRYGSVYATTTQQTYNPTGIVTFDLFDQPTTGNGSITEVGFFTLYGASETSSPSLAGDLTFTSTVVAAPEPSTYALFGIGALVMIIAVRRRNMLQS